MGMAASQGRLLFMTARLSNNEFEQQCVAYSKQTLAESSQAANDKYLNALNATQYKLITGYNGSTPTYEDVTYNLLTGLNSVATSKQYILQDNKGQILVTDKIAQAFESANGNYNKFLEKIDNLSQIEQTEVTAQDVHEAWDKYLVAVGLSNYDKNDGVPDKEHILGFGLNQELAANNDLSVEYPTYNSAYVEKDGQKIYVYKGEDTTGDYYYIKNYEVKAQAYTNPDNTTSYYAYYEVDKPNKETEIVKLTDIKVDYDKESGEFTYSYPRIVNTKEFTFEDGTTDDNALGKVALDADGNTIYDSSNTLYIMPYKYDNDNYVYTKEENTEFRKDGDNLKTNVCDIEFGYEEQNDILYYEGTCSEHQNLYDYAMELTKKHALGSKYDKEYDPDKINYYKNIYNEMITKGYTTYARMREEGYMSATETNEATAFKNSNWLIRQLQTGKLTMSYFSAVDKEFVATTLDDDESITEKEDTKKIAIAEQEYNNSMDRIESEDKRFDMQLNKLEAEHSALTTEYDAIVKVISKNVEKSFGTFNA